ncbi:hypothetical protein KY363_08115 [Candidatus Woesearchaeota archaeon]|nr:hypothetical protein [Candidatus Woesearchaeota archaeon]
MANLPILGTALIGAILSAYLIYVEQMLKRDSHYKAMCDLGNRISCTKVATSKYAYTLKISNALAGLAFYSVVILLAGLGMIQLIFYLSALAMLFSMYLGYVSFFRMKHFCLVCTATYVVNIFLLILSFSAL